MVMEENGDEDRSPPKSPINDHLRAMQKMCSVEHNVEPVRPAQTLNRHQCPFCFKNFSSSSALMIHKRTHTGSVVRKCVFSLQIVTILH